MYLLLDTLKLLSSQQTYQVNLLLCCNFSYSECATSWNLSQAMPASGQQLTSTDRLSFCNLVSLKGVLLISSLLSPSTITPPTYIFHMSSYHRSKALPGLTINVLSSTNYVKLSNCRIYVSHNISGAITNIGN